MNPKSQQEFEWLDKVLLGFISSYEGGDLVLVSDKKKQHKRLPSAKQSIIQEVQRMLVNSFAEGAALVVKNLRSRGIEVTDADLLHSPMNVGEADWAKLLAQLKANNGGSDE